MDGVGDFALNGDDWNRLSLDLRLLLFVVEDELPKVRNLGGCLFTVGESSIVCFFFLVSRDSKSELISATFNALRASVTDSVKGNKTCFHVNSQMQNQKYIFMWNNY